MPLESKLRVAIIGCGAVTELAHLPAAARVQNCQITLLVDPNQSRREHLARMFKVQRTAANVSEAADVFDAAIVATPHAFHAPLTEQLASLGKSVLVEKPMAKTAAECRTMIDAADKSGITLAVGLMRRFLWAHRYVRDLIRSGTFGRVQEFDFAEGSIYYWPVASDFFFRREAAGGGVLIDAGAHTLDSVLQWLGPVAEVDYFDDAEGGVEANALLKLRMQSGAIGTIELSRTRSLRNTALIRMERATLEVGLAENRLKISLPHQPYIVAGPVTSLQEPGVEQDYLATIAEQLQHWVDAAISGRPPYVDGRSALESVELIETCYRRRQPLLLEWDGHAVSQIGYRTR